MYLYYKNKKKSFHKDSIVIEVDKGGGAISLGMFIFTFNKYSGANLTNTIKHEYGHSIQSKILGPLYLLIIGIPSFI